MSLTKTVEYLIANDKKLYKLFDDYFAKFRAFIETTTPTI